MFGSRRAMSGRRDAAASMNRREAESFLNRGQHHRLARGDERGDGRFLAFIPVHECEPERPFVAARGGFETF